MKKNINIIQINGFRGILMVIAIGICLIAGFIAFPGLVIKSAWNLLAFKFGLNSINLLQGILLWSIMIVGYLAFKKNPFMIELKSSKELSDEEMETVMRKIRLEQQKDLITKAIMNAQKKEHLDIIEHDVKQDEEENSTKNMLDN